MTRIRATATAVGAAVAAIALTAGCAAGKDAQTAYEKPSIDGAQGVVGQIQLESVALHAPSGDSYAKGATVPLTIYIANNGTSADTLTKISSASFPGGYTISTAASSSSSGSSASSSGGTSGATTAKIGAGSAVGFGLQNLGISGGGAANSIKLKNLSKQLFPGMAVKITFTFANAGQTTVTVPVQTSDEPNERQLPSGSGSAGGSD